MPAATGSGATRQFRTPQEKMVAKLEADRASHQKAAKKAKKTQAAPEAQDEDPEDDEQEEPPTEKRKFGAAPEKKDKRYSGYLETVMRTVKLKLCPSTTQKRQLRHWAGAYRFTYNFALDQLQKHPKVSKATLRNALVAKKAPPAGKATLVPHLLSREPWLCKTPKAIRQQAVFEAHKNFRAALKQGPGHECKPKAHNAATWCIMVEDALRLLPNRRVRLVLPSSSKKTAKGRTKEIRPARQFVVRYRGRKLPSWMDPTTFTETETKPPCDARITMVCGSYYLILAYEDRAAQPPAVAYDGHIAGLDPGIRKFQACYGTDGRVAFLGTGGYKRRMVRRMYVKDFLDRCLRAPKSHPLRVTGKQRKAMKRKRALLQERMANIRRDMHHKIAHWLTSNYKAVVIGKLPKHIISRDRSLPKIVKRAYNALGHFQFRCCLLEKCKARGIVYVELNESYTSKTCTGCGRIHETLGSSETFRCDNPNCPLAGCKWDRDVNGARNMILKSLSESYLRVNSLVPLRGDTAAKGAKSDTLALREPLWTKNPQGLSLALDVLGAHECSGTVRCSKA